MMPGRSVASILLLALHGLLCLHLVARAAETTDDDDGVIKDSSSFHLHVTAPVVAPDGPEERREHFRAMEANDLLRHERRMSSSGRRKDKEKSKVPETMDVGDMFMELPMRSALNIAHVSMYLVTVRFGTPAMPFTLALDTATDLTWISCRLRRRKGKHYGLASTAQTMSVGEDGVPQKQVKKRYYRPALSSTWRRIHCYQPLCGALNYVQCPIDNTTESCTYFQRLQDQTESMGIYGQEKMTVMLSDGNMAKLPGLVVGCSLMESGANVDAHDGVLALGNGDASFGLIASSRFSQRFSFCLLNSNSSRNTSSYLTFGPNSAVEGPGTMMTGITYSWDLKAGFGFHVDRITVGGQPLDIPAHLWNESLSGGGVILDTGTSLTGLVPEVYDAVTAAMDRHLSHLRLPPDEIAGFEFCYKLKLDGDDNDNNNDNVTIPSFAMDLRWGARLEPDAKSVLLPEVVPGVACLSFRKLDRGPNIIGNLLMQEHIWEFRHTEGAMFFRKDKCTNHHLKGSSASNVRPSPTPVN